jgi:hypothetical protein
MRVPGPGVVTGRILTAGSGGVNRTEIYGRRGATHCALTARERLEQHAHVEGLFAAWIVQVAGIERVGAIAGGKDEAHLTPGEPATHRFVPWLSPELQLRLVRRCGVNGMAIRHETPSSRKMSSEFAYSEKGSACSISWRP